MLHGSGIIILGNTVAAYVFTDIYTLSLAALGLWVHISAKSLATIVCNHSITSICTTLEVKMKVPHSGI